MCVLSVLHYSTNSTPYLVCQPSALDILFLAFSQYGTIKSNNYYETIVKLSKIYVAAHRASSYVYKESSIVNFMIIKGFSCYIKFFSYVCITCMVLYNLPRPSK